MDLGGGSGGGSAAGIRDAHHCFVPQGVLAGRRCRSRVRATAGGARAVAPLRAAGQKNSTCGMNGRSAAQGAVAGRRGRLIEDGPGRRQHHPQNEMRRLSNRRVDNVRPGALRRRDRLTPDRTRCVSKRSTAQPPTASPTHFLVKLVLAAPASFLVAAVASQVAAASFWHLVMKLVIAAPASFLSVARLLQVSSARAAPRPAARMPAQSTIRIIPITLPITMAANRLSRSLAPHRRMTADRGAVKACGVDTRP